ncbi:hypothetical protein CYMTET_34119 [Cymbomonas tetramitiformis]|uniref:Uncharacterized protein n=1 Tax=Cymbomonas tetramitiformis TaxID=36881 RepID=A0AAE0FBQ8_9CHLO|nr:hypothetical protein CYMTET_34119 [Cymbomonas tetramitiformis]
MDAAIRFATRLRKMHIFFYIFFKLLIRVRSETIASGNIQIPNSTVQILHAPTASTASIEEPRYKIAYVRLHTPGSSALNSLFVRFIQSRGGNVYKKQEKNLSPMDLRRRFGYSYNRRPSEGYFNLVPQYLSATALWDGDFAQLYGFYAGLLGTGYSCFTILGDPQAHYAYRFSEIARSANFKNQSDKQEQYAKFVQAKMLRNPLATELNLHSHEDVLRFMSVELPMFRLILLAERLEESLVVLRHYLKWTYEDVLYLEPTW